MGNTNARCVIQIEKKSGEIFVNFLNERIDYYSEKWGLDKKKLQPSRVFISEKNYVFDWDSLCYQAEFYCDLLDYGYGLKDNNGVRFVQGIYDENVVVKGQEFYIDVIVPHAPKFDYEKFLEVHRIMSG